MRTRKIPELEKEKLRNKYSLHLRHNEIRIRIKKIEQIFRHIGLSEVKKLSIDEAFAFGRNEWKYGTTSEEARLAKSAFFEKVTTAVKEGMKKGGDPILFLFLPTAGEPEIFLPSEVQKVGMEEIEYDIDIKKAFIGISKCDSPKKWLDEQLEEAIIGPVKAPNIPEGASGYMYVYKLDWHFMIGGEIADFVCYYKNKK